MAVQNIDSQQAKIVSMFRLLLIVLTSIVSGSLTANAAASCTDLFLSSQGKLAVVQQLGLTDRDVQYLNRQLRNNLRFPNGEPEEALIRAVDAARSLDAHEKIELLSTLKTASPFSEELVNASLRLALGDVPAWQALVKGIVEETPTDFEHFAIYGFWAHRVTEMSGPERAQILKTVGRFYNKARSASDGHSSPKRELDYLIHASLRGGEQISSLIQTGMDPESAYDQYLASQNHLLFHARSSRGHYDGKVVFAALKEIQQGVRENDYGPLLIGGSFTAGRANLNKSDIDYMRDSDYSLAPKEEEGLNTAIRRRLKALGVGSRLKVEHFPGPLGTPRDRSYAGDLASSNPVLFYVSKDHIQMWVYPTKFWKIGDSYESSMFEPTVHSID